MPTYLERVTSSLVYMVNSLIEESKHPLSSFYLNDHKKLKEVLKELKARRQKTLLIGVTYALLDFAEIMDEPIPELIIMETGGVKCTWF